MTLDEFNAWCDTHAPGVPREKVLFYKHRTHPSDRGRAMYSPDARAWVGFWPDGTPLTGCDEGTGLERTWFWKTEAEALAVIREGLARNGE